MPRHLLLEFDRILSGRLLSITYYKINKGSSLINNFYWDLDSIDGKIISSDNIKYVYYEDYTFLRTKSFRKD